MWLYLLSRKITMEFVVKYLPHHKTVHNIINFWTSNIIIFPLRRMLSIRLSHLHSPSFFDVVYLTPLSLFSIQHNIPTYAMLRTCCYCVLWCYFTFCSKVIAFLFNFSIHSPRTLRNFHIHWVAEGRAYLTYMWKFSNLLLVITRAKEKCEEEIVEGASVRWKIKGSHNTWKYFRSLYPHTPNK